MNIGFDPIAEIDLQEAFNYYEKQVDGLGEEFLEEVDKALDLIVTFPSAFPNKYQNLREYPLPRFPFLIYYEFLPDELRVLSVFHTSRRPK